tara:strand:+ start:21641 stop:22024 length:384 start_codon:yes stop_codon:yes gene_type:complete
MDLDTVRAGLPSMTRQGFGENANILPMREGKMAGAGADPTREVQEGLRGRFDFAPELEQMGGGRSSETNRANVISPHASVSFALADLAWVPKQGDHVERQTAAPELYRIDRILDPLPAVVLCAISRI